MQILLYILIGIFVLFVILGLAIANFADGQLDSYYNELGSDIAVLGLPASTFCQLVISSKLGGRIAVSRVAGVYGGRYLPGKARIELADDVYSSGSVAAIAVTAHELGHALQFKENPKILVRNYKFSKLIKFLGMMLFPTFISAIVLFLLDFIIISIILLSVCVLSFLLALALKIFTIRIEKQASKNAIGLLLEFSALSDEQLGRAKKLLSYAKMTYVADFFKALLCWTFLTKRTKIF